MGLVGTYMYMYNLMNRISDSYAKYVPVVDFADMSGTDSTVFQSLNLLLPGTAQRDTNRAPETSTT